MAKRTFEYVLALASKPAGKPSILDWCPFGQDTLNDIIDKHNKNYEASLRKIPWSSLDIDESGRFMKVSNHDLSDLDRMNFDQFSKIKFVFANLGEIESGDSVEHVKAAMNHARHKYYLVQISGKPPLPSERTRFTPSPVLPSRPEVMDDQPQLEQWLSEVYQVYSWAIEAMPIKGGGTGGVARSISSGGSADIITVGQPITLMGELKWSHLYDLVEHSDVAKSVPLSRSLADIALEVRDTAIEKGLSKAETKTLAQKVILQDVGVGYVGAYVANKLDLTGNERLVLDCLRKPVEEISVDDNYLGKTHNLDVVTIKLAKPFAALSRSESALCSDMRLSDKSARVILRKSAETVGKIEKLKNAVETYDTGLILPFDATDLLL